MSVRWLLAIVGGLVLVWVALRHGRDSLATDASAGEPASRRGGELLLSRIASERAQGARQLASLGWEEAAEHIPLLMEALNDEEEMARAAAQEALLDLGDRVLPSVLGELDKLTDGPPVEDWDALLAIRLMGVRLYTAAGLLLEEPRGKVVSDTEALRSITSFTCIPFYRVGDAFVVRRVAARMYQDPLLPRGAAPRMALARAIVVLGAEEARVSATRPAQRVVTPPRDAVTQLVSILDSSDVTYAALGAGLIARLGLGGVPVGVVSKLQHLIDRAPGPADGSPALAAQLAGLALSVLGRMSSEARQVLSELPRDIRGVVAYAASANGGYVPWAAWLQDPDPASRLEMALWALESRGGPGPDVLNMVQPMLLEALGGERTGGGPARDAIAYAVGTSAAWCAHALGRLGPGNPTVLERVEKYFDSVRELAISRILAACGAVRLGSTRSDVLAVLETTVLDGPPRIEGLKDEDMLIALRNLAMSALADGASQRGRATAMAFVTRFEREHAVFPRSYVALLGAMTKCLGGASGEDRARSVASLEYLLSIPVEGGDTSASALQAIENEEGLDASYRVRVAALRALGDLDGAALVAANAVKSLERSADVRVRWHAARATRLLESSR